jgi:hypothetical protein
MSKHTPWTVIEEDAVVYIIEGIGIICSLLPLVPDETVADTLKRALLISKALEMHKLLERIKEAPPTHGMLGDQAELWAQIEDDACALLEEIDS